MKTFTIAFTLNNRTTYLDNLFTETSWPYIDPSNFRTTNLKNGHRMTKKEANDFIEYG